MRSTRLRVILASSVAFGPAWAHGSVLADGGVDGDFFDFCNGDPDGSNGMSNATSGVFGSRRTLLDDFEVGHIEYIYALSWRSVWDTPMGGAMGTGAEFSIRSDVNGTPGATIATAQLATYSEVYTGNILFSREEVQHYATFDPVYVSCPGGCWFEATVVGPENNFWLTREAVNGRECWVNYEDLAGLQPVSEYSGSRFDLGWTMHGFNGSALPGACCFDDASCLDNLATCDCVALGGSPRGDHTTCGDTACPPLGACCFEDETCSDEFTAKECVAAGGEFQGLGLSCLQTSCVTLGACCLANDTCIGNADVDECETAGGVFHPDRTCLDVGCDLLGACCVYDGTCLELVGDDCLSIPGDFIGPGDRCSDVACPAFGACCAADDSCTEGVVASDCAASGGTFLGNGSRCADPVARILVDPPFAPARLGDAVHIDGDTAVVGALLLLDTGAAYIVERDAGGPDAWGRVATLQGSGTNSGDCFGEYVAISGNIALVGSVWHDTPDTNAGRVWVFERDANNPVAWNEVATIAPTELERGDRFGHVALDGGTAVIGAPGDDIAGSAYVYRHEGANWVEVAKLAPAAPSAFDEFGSATAIHGTTAVVSAPFDDDAGENAGAVYVFERDAGGPNGWKQVAFLTADDATEEDRFGVSLAISGATLLVGARDSVHFFDRDPDSGEWAHVLEIEGDPTTDFGHAVAVSGDNAAIGAPFAQHPIGTPAGAVHFLRRDQGGPGQWGEMATVLSPDAGPNDRFGDAVAASGSTVIVGAPLYDRPLTWSGEAVILEVLECTTCPADLDDSGAVDFGDVRAILIAWGNAGGPEDLDDDGTVGVGDLLIVLAAWGPCG